MAPRAKRKFGDPCSNPRSTVLKEVLWHCWDVSAPPQWFDVPIVIRRQGNCAPLVPLVTPLYENKGSQFKFWRKQTFSALKDEQIVATRFSEEQTIKRATCNTGLSAYIKWKQIWSGWTYWKCASLVATGGEVDAINSDLLALSERLRQGLLTSEQTETLQSLRKGRLNWTASWKEKKEI